MNIAPWLIAAGLGTKAWFEARAAAGLPEDDFFVLRHGETQRLARN